MMEAIIEVGLGVAIIAGIGAYKVGEHFHLRKIERLERQNAYITKRNVDLRNRLDAAQRSERDARTRQFIAERDTAILEAREKEWAKRLMAQMTESEQAA
jgi:uncharacterized LabA/DUF88 family protein